VRRTYKHDFSSRILNFRQAGVVIVWFVLLALVLIGIVALALDIGLQTLRLYQAKAVADRAAHAGAVELDGTIQGWRKAKRSALAAIQESNIIASGVNFRSLILRETSAKQSFSDPLELPPFNDSADFQFNTVASSTGKQTMGVIERGSYWFGNNDDFTKFSFDSFDNPESNYVQTWQIKINGGLREVRVVRVGDMPAYALANAVRVQIYLPQTRTLLGHTLGIPYFKEKVQASVAINDNLLQFPTAPFAIPACYLLLDPNWPDNENKTYETDGYQPEAQCPRDLVFMETRWKVPERREGVVRNDLYPRHPVTKHYPWEDPSIPHLKGILGLPAQPGTEDARLKPLELAYELDRMTQGTSSLAAKLGQPFRPLDDSVKDPDGNPAIGEPHLLGNNTLRAKLADWINSGPALLNDEFGTGSAPKGNFPHLLGLKEGADLFIELYRGVPSGSYGVLRFPMANLIPNLTDPTGWSDTLDKEHRKPEDRKNVWTNPLCHENGGSGIAAVRRNDPAARVRVVNAMVIIPGRKDEFTMFKYCDYVHRFQLEPREDVLPTWNTHPRVVGFVQVVVYDFNLEDLEARYGATPPGDRNPMLVPYEKELIPLDPVGEPSGAADCAYFSHCSLKRDTCTLVAPPRGKQQALWFPMTRRSDWDACTQSDFSGVLSPPPVSRPPDPAMPPHPCQPDPYKPDQYPEIWPLERINDFEWSKVSAHCLPFAIDPDCVPAHEDKCQSIKNLSPDYGCGGIRARLKCEDSGIFRSARPGRRPRLVD